MSLAWHSKGTVLRNITGGCLSSVLTTFISPELQMECIFIQQSLTFPSSLFPMFFCWECYLLPSPQFLALLIKTLLSAAGFPLLCCLESPAHPWECKLVTKKQYNWHIYAKSSHINFRINVLRSAKILLTCWFAVALYL